MRYYGVKVGGKLYIRTPKGNLLPLGFLADIEKLFEELEVGKP
ncbi:hypothetical protein [uncultured Brevibacillus sp.]|nr:hypothetical protein [uncultured Brevibacillus sp.]